MVWSKIIRKILFFLLSKLDKVIVVSKEEESIFLKKFNKNKIELIYNSIKLEDINILKEEDIPKNELSIFDKSFIFLNI
jgi:hypothetical protein